MKKRIEISNKLKRLSNILNKFNTLYVTGGYVRNSLLNLRCDDIDICAAISPDTVIKALENTEYSAIPINLRLGTLKIISENESYEYTAFRLDSYPKSSGIHTPTEIKFTNELLEDAKRRDFSINAIYYDISSNKLIDPFNGLEDINKKVLRTTISPSRVFSEDGLRILRLIRFAAELDFNIDKDTYFAARANNNLLMDIAPERIQTEFLKILYADSKYNMQSAHYKGLKLLHETGVLDIIFPELIISLDENLMQMDKDLRLYQLVYNNPREIILAQLKLLKFNNSIIKAVIRLKDLLGLKYVTKRSIINLIIDNYSIIKMVIKLFYTNNRDKEAKAIEKVIHQINNKKLPYSVVDLKVDGKDLIALDVVKHKRAKVLKELLIYCIDNEINDRERQLKYLEEKA